MRVCIYRPRSFRRADHRFPEGARARGREADRRSGIRGDDWGLHANDDVPPLGGPGDRRRGDARASARTAALPFSSRLLFPPIPILHCSGPTGSALHGITVGPAAGLCRVRDRRFRITSEWVLFLRGSDLRILNGRQGERGVLPLHGRRRVSFFVFLQNLFRVISSNRTNRCFPGDLVF